MKYFALPLLLLFIGCGSSSSSPKSITDPLFSTAWHLAYSEEVASEVELSKESHLHLSQSWQHFSGKDITVAIIDDGFNTQHPDLKENIYLTYNAEDGSSDIDDTSASYHGQQVAGIIAASNNNIGSLGIAYNAKLILIRIDLSSSSDVSTLKAFDYAKEHGANIINCSWGSYNMSEALYEKISETVDANITVLFAVGNDNRSLDDDGINDESEHPKVIAVGASDERNIRAWYSNYGAALDVIAPGASTKGIITTNKTDYSYFAGTSASTPCASATVALMLSNQPSLLPAQVKSILHVKSDKIGELEYIDGFNTHYGYGKINVDRAIF